MSFTRQVWLPERLAESRSRSATITGILPQGIFIHKHLIIFHRDLSTTPGGSIYATTPGGSRILYDRNALLYLRNSPLSKTPTNLPVIPGLTTGVNTPNSQDVQV